MFELDRYEYSEDVNLGLLAHRPSGVRVLDVGCGSGLLGSELKAGGNEVWGLDNAVDVEGVAAGRLDRFVRADVTDGAAVEAALGGETFDVLVFADVLEHLPDPVATLRAHLGNLRPGGTVMVSVPNVAIWNVRLGLLAGRFAPTSTGTLDKTHLRFFTRATLDRLLAEAGLTVQWRDITPGLARPFVPLAKRFGGAEDDRRALIDSRPYALYRRLVYPLEHRIASLAPGPLAFQLLAGATRA